MSKLNKLVWPIFENLYPWLVLIILGWFTFTYFFILPYSGVSISQHKTVLNIFADQKGENHLEPGDIIQRVGAVTYQDTQKDLTRSYFVNSKPGDRVEIVFERQGQQKTIQYIIPNITIEEIIEARLNSQWFVPYIFWLAGVVSLLFLKPRSLMRLMLASFCFITATWISVSNLSSVNFMNGSLILRSLIWLSLPIYWHLHWLFPSPLKRLPWGVWALIYSLSAVMAVVSWLQLVSSNFYFVGFIAAIGGSLLLLGVHLIFQPTERRSLAGLAASLGMVLMPVLAVALMGILNIPLANPAIVVLGLAALPGFYFFTLFRRQLRPDQAQRARRLVLLYVFAILISLLFSVFLMVLMQFPIFFKYIDLLGYSAFFFLVLIALVNFLPFLVLPALADEHLTVSLGTNRLSFSANRAAGGIIFILLEALVVLALIGLLRLLTFPGVNEVRLALGVLVMGFGSLLFYRPFQNFFERSVLGIKLSPETLIQVYAGRITTSLQVDALQKVLVDEVLPSLLVRRFAQANLEGEKLVFEFGLRCTAADLPETELIPRLPSLCSRLLEMGEEMGLPQWVRLVLALQINHETRGYWFLGQRDPDDHYSEDDISTLQTLAGQTALAGVNIAQAKALEALYFTDIERNEVQRLHLAAELHDDVLSQMSVISQNLQASEPAAIIAYEQSVAHIREIINGLRPAMLNFGLRTALEGLADELNDRHARGPQLIIELPPSSQRYDERVELYLFRVVQQACSNAIQHAECKSICISGHLDEDEVDLRIIDDGQGFQAGVEINLPALLTGKHFGLAGMYERAALIGATFRIESSAAQGCTVVLNWQKK